MDKIIIGDYFYGHATRYLVSDDLVDRLNNRITVMVLVLCIFITTGNIFIGKPINCWTPAEFKGPHDGYANSICWLKGSYYLPSDEITIPDRSKPRAYYVSYYQWTPFILLGMALLFLLPRLLWHAFTRQGGLNIPQLVKKIKDDPDYDKGPDLAKKSLYRYLRLQQKFKGTICCGLRCRGFYLGYTLMYLFIKLLYAANTLAQFFLLNMFLSFHFTGFGIEVLRRTINGDDWFESPRFPRVTMCDFMIRHLGSNQHWYAIQCNLPINMYNEKIFFGIWVWLLVLTVVNVLSLVSWVVSLTKARRVATVRKYLWNSDSEKEEWLGQPSSETTTLARGPVTRKDYSDFVDYLTWDGFLIFRIIAHNTDEMAAGQIIEYLFRQCKVDNRLKSNNV